MQIFFQGDRRLGTLHALQRRSDAPGTDRSQALGTAVGNGRLEKQHLQQLGKPTNRFNSLPSS